MNTDVIIQARMSSTRLPGKVLIPICGRPMLAHIMSRLKHCVSVRKVIVATSTNPQDDAIIDLCKQGNVDFFRGSEFDVLDRFYQTARQFGTDLVVRITADCPLIDPEVVDEVIDPCLETESHFDGSSNVLNRRYPRGLDTEVIFFQALERCWKETAKEYQREHVFPYMYEHPEEFVFKSVECKQDLSRFRWTVDAADDLFLIREVYAALYQENQLFKMQDVLDLFERNPHLAKMNEHVRQKELGHSGK